MERMKESHASDRKEWDLERNRLMDQFEITNSNLLSAQSEVDKLRSEIAYLTGQCDELKLIASEYEKQSIEFGKMKEDLVKKSEEIDRLASMIESLKAKEASKDKEIGELRHELERIEKSYAIKQSEWNKECERLQKLYRASESELTLTKKEVHDLLMEIKNLKDRNLRLTNQLERYETTKTSAIEAAECESAAKSELLSKLKNECKQLREQRLVLEKDKAALIGKLDSLRKQVGELNADANNDCLAYNREKERMEDSINELKEKLLKLQNESRDMKTKTKTANAGEAGDDSDATTAAKRKKKRKLNPDDSSGSSYNLLYYGGAVMFGVAIGVSCCYLLGWSPKQWKNINEKSSRNVVESTKDAVSDMAATAASASQKSATAIPFRKKLQ